MVIQEQKMKYNYFLNRYYNGCNYIEAHPTEYDKYIEKIEEFKAQMEDLLTEIEKKQKVTDDEKLGGFEIC